MNDRVKNSNCNLPKAALEQVDPGDREDFNLTIFEVMAPYFERFMSIIATNNANAELSVLARTEYCGCYASARDHLAQAQRIRIRSGEPQEWAAWDEQVQEAASTDEPVQMPVDVSYDMLDDDALLQQAASGGILFESINAEGDELRVRLRVEISANDQLSSITWYHNGDDETRHLMTPGATLELVRLDEPQWDDQPWRYWAHGVQTV